MSPNLRLPLNSILAQTRIKRNSALTALLFLSITFASIACLAQQSAIPEPGSESKDGMASTNPVAAAITVPAGENIALVLMHPIQSRYIHRGDDIYAQTTSPVVAGNQVVIPPGTFVQGKVDRLSRNGSRAELYLQSMAITFPDGYVAPVAGPITMQSSDGYAIKDPGKGRMAGAFALPAAGLGIGALIGHATASSQGTTITSTLPPGCTGPPPGCLSSSVTGPADTGKNTAIGAMVGGAIGAVASIALLLNSHDFFLDVGSPVEMTLQHPLSLVQDQVAEAIHDAAQHPAPPPPVPPRPQAAPTPTSNDPGTCWTPGTPGTPDVDIPGTPAVGNSPGTPPVHIPGIPRTPPIAHPCL